MTNFYCTDILDPAKKLGRIYPETIGENTIDSFLVNKTGITDKFFFQSSVNTMKSSHFLVICDDLGVNTAYLPLGINEPIEIYSVIEAVNWTNPLQPNALLIKDVTNYLEVMEYALSTRLYFKSVEIYEPRQMIVYEGINYLIVNKDNNAYVAIKDCTDVILTDIKFRNDFYSLVIWGAIYPLLGKAPVSKSYVDARDILTLRESKEYTDSFYLANINNRVVSSEIAIEPNLDMQYEVFIFNGIVETELTQILPTKDILNAQYMIVNNRPYSINVSINSVLTEIEPNTIISFIQTGELEEKTITLAYKTATDTAIKDIIADIETINADIVDVKSDITGLQDSKIDITEKAVAGGVATLDDTTGKVPLSQIPSSIIGDMHYVDIWNAETNIPILSNIPTIPLGFYYRVTVAGTQFGIDFSIGDGIISSGTPNNPTHWDRIPNNNAVNSVNSKIGDVEIDKADVGLGEVNNTSDVNKPISTATQQALTQNEALITANTNKISTNKTATEQNLTKIEALEGNTVTPLELDTQIQTRTPKGAFYHNDGNSYFDPRNYEKTNLEGYFINYFGIQMGEQIFDFGKSELYCVQTGAVTRTGFIVASIELMVRNYGTSVYHKTDGDFDYNDFYVDFEYQETVLKTGNYNVMNNLSNLQVYNYTGQIIAKGSDINEPKFNVIANSNAVSNGGIIRHADKYWRRGDLISDDTENVSFVENPLSETFVLTIENGFPGFSRSKKWVAIIQDINTIASSPATKISLEGLKEKPLDFSTKEYKPIINDKAQAEWVDAYIVEDFLTVGGHVKVLTITQ